MNRFCKGMIAGAKPFMQIGKESAERADFCYDKLCKKVDELNSDFVDVVNIVAEENPLLRKEIVELFKRKKNAPKPKSYTISIIYSPEYFTTADKLRQILNKMGNCSSIQTYERYRYNNRKTDYYILLTNEKPQEDCESHEVFKANGCSVIENGKLIYCNISPMALIEDSQWRSFKNTYQKITNKVIGSKNKATKAWKRINRRNVCCDKILGNFACFVDSVDLFLDKHEEDNIFTEIMAVPTRFLWFFSGVVGELMLIPFAFFALLGGEVMNKLDSKNPATIKEVQAEIVQMKVAEYIRNKQLVQLI